MIRRPRRSRHWRDQAWRSDASQLGAPCKTGTKQVRSGVPKEPFQPARFGR